MKGKENNYIPEKSSVGRSFNSAALLYEKTAVLQQRIGERLVERLEVIKLKPGKILDLGSGTGLAARALANNYRSARLLELDLALEMLRQSRKNRTTKLFHRHSYLCADAEQLPLADNEIDLVFSNLMLQWSGNLEQSFSEVKRVLQANGLFIFSTFGPDTLRELRRSWAAVDDNIHVNAFIDMHDIGDALIRAGFEQPVMETEMFTLTYDDGYSLMRELKQIGAHNVAQGRRRSVTGKKRLQAMLTAYESLKQDGKLPASFEVVYGHAWSPASANNRAGAQQTAVFPVAALKRSHERQP